MNQNKNLEHYLNLPWTRVFIRYKDGSYFAEIKELKGCMTEGTDLLDAGRMLDDALNCWLEVALQDNFDIPEPNISEDDLNDYSGKFNVRVPKSIHKELVEKSKKENISLNAVINMLLIRSLAS